jgi:glycosyltransferase involved in cell wall biosynthesis
METNPKVSVCIAAYNAAPFVSQCLKSILNQTLTDLEIVIVDDASTDETWRVISSFTDSRIRLYRNEQNGGAVRAYNRAVENARGQYITYFPSDDEMIAPSNLLEKATMLDANPNLGMVYSDSYLMDAAGNITGTYWAREGYMPVRGMLNAELLLSVGMIVIGHSTLIRHSVLNHVGLMDPRLRHAHDGDLWLRIAAKAPIDFIAKPLVAWRLHGKNSHGRGDPIEYMERVHILEKMARQYPDLLTERTLQMMLASYTALAGLQLVRKDRSFARRYFIKAVHLCPYHIPAWIWLANSYLGVPALWNFVVYKKLLLKMRQLFSN